MATRVELDRELRTLQAQLFRTKRSLVWGGPFVLALVFILGQRLSLGSAMAIAIALVALAGNVWAVIAGRRRIEVLKRQLTEPETLPAAGVQCAPQTEMQNHSVHSQVLGEFRWDDEADGWVAQYAEHGHRLRVVVDGADRPDPGALKRAEEMFSNWHEHRQRIALFFAAEAASYRNSDLYDEVLGLQVAEVAFPIAHKGDAYVAVWFQGPTDVRQWHMEFDDRKVRHFGFQW